mgnify:CR=1 FL=1|tara:strand:- start:1714 stop:2052 length:339 start_codon:yes stop_codon:yes gene_type:complete
MSDTNKATAPSEAPATAPATGGPVDLTVQDLNTLRTVIDIATQRGAFKANELQAVGTTYNKLDMFLQQVQKAQQEAQPTPEGVPATAQPISGADAMAAMSGEVPATATTEKK